MVNLPMPGYIECMLLWFQHPNPMHPEYLPHPWQKPDYGACTQYAPAEDLSPALDASDSKWVQEVIGVLLYYAQAVDSTMLAALGTLATQQAKGTHMTMATLTQLLNYCTTNPNATVHFHTSNMVLWSHSVIAHAHHVQVLYVIYLSTYLAICEHTVCISIGQTQIDYVFDDT